MGIIRLLHRNNSSFRSVIVDGRRQRLKGILPSREALRHACWNNTPPFCSSSITQLTKPCSTPAYLQSNRTKTTVSTVPQKHVNASGDAGTNVVGRLCVSSNHPLSIESATAPIVYPTEQRWKAIPPANVVHLSIGAVYVYSMWTPGLTTALGVVTSSALDWGYTDVLPVFSMAAVTLGLTTHFGGEWVERSGPRLAGTVGSICWGSALITTGIGVEFHSLPLVYAGYSLLGGIGWGLCYLAPVTTCMKWFPDRRGLATGLALSCFGLGAAIAPPIIQSFIDLFFVAPDFIGSLHDVTLSTLPDGSQVISECSQNGIPHKPVVVATDMDLAKVTDSSLSPGVYYLNSGDTGLSKALISLGVIYGSVGTVASRFMKVPSPGWVPSGYEVDQKTTAGTKVGLPVDYVMKTNQFPLLWFSVFGNATGGLALLSSSKLMISDIWAGALPGIVTASFCTGYVAALGSANAMGRFGWAFASDWIGRKNTYSLFALGVPIVGGCPYLCHAAMESTGSNEAILPLAAFYTGSILAITFYGGIFSVLPAYIADLYGQKNAGAIHGKVLTAWAASAVCGPMGLAYLRTSAEKNAIQDLLDRVDDTMFEETFDCVKANAEPLIDAKTVTISRLMEIAPGGTIDPTPFLYDSTCYVAAGLITASAFANLAIRPLNVAKILKRMEQERA